MVLVEDSQSPPDVATSNSDTITLAIASGKPGASLTCNGGGAPTAVAVNGQATFSGCQIVGTAWDQYSVTASDSTTAGISSVTSGLFPITFGAPSKLVFGTQPGGGANGAAWSSQPSVTIEDSGGNTVSNSTQTVTLRIAPGSPAGTLSCTGGTSMAAASGVANFSGCQIVGPVGTYTIRARVSGVASVTSTSFSITVGAPAQLAFSTQPGGGANGDAWSTQPAVTIQDSGGNTVTSSTDTVTLAIASGPSGNLTCNGGSDSVAAISGVATFSGCQIVGLTGSYALTATATDPVTGPLSPDTSTSLTITVGTPNKLAFSTQPGGGANGAVWSTQPAVTIEDSGGNPVTTSTDTVTLAIESGPSGSLTCSGGTDSVAAISGVATFTGCQIVGPTGTYTLTATATDPVTGALSPATSLILTITVGQAKQLVFTTAPGGGPSGIAWATQPVVTVEDSGGNAVTTLRGHRHASLGPSRQLHLQRGSFPWPPPPASRPSTAVRSSATGSTASALPPLA